MNALEKRIHEMPLEELMGLHRHISKVERCLRFNRNGARHRGPELLREIFKRVAKGA